MDIETNMFDIKQLFFNNMQLLGFNAQAMEAANHIPFNNTMFELPNKRGSEIVLHFLFEKLNPSMCREAFRDCWPIFDKKREQAFRKACLNWLTNISQEDPYSHLPRINASLFMSPGGEKFYQMLFHFSEHVLQKVLDTELGTESSDLLRYPVLNAQNVQMCYEINKNLVCAAIRQQKTKYFGTVRLNVKANKAWKDFADEHVHKYRKENKEIRELEYKIRQEQQRAVEASMARGSPVKKRGHSEQFDSEFDQGTIERAQRIQQVREMWKQVADYENTAATEHEVVESIVERTVHKYKLDAADISVKVPDMLLRECSEEIRRRNVDNVYQGGKLNPVSVLQLWNLCLHLYTAKIKEVGMPKYDAKDVQKLTSQVHVQQNYTQRTKTLRQQMAERIPVLKVSVAELREKLDTVIFTNMSPASIRTTSLGLGLVGPSPEIRFSPEQGKTPEGGIGVSPPSKYYIDTPVAAEQITENIRQAVRVEPKTLFKQPDLLKQGTRHQEPSSIPRSDRSHASSRASSRPSSARSHTSSKGSLKSTPKSSRSAQNLVTKRKEDKSFTKVTSPRSMMERLNIGDSLRQEADGQELDNDLPSSQPLSARSDKSDASSKYTLTARSDRSKASNRVTKYGDQWDVSKPRASKKTAADLLVDEIMGEGKILSPFNSGLEAFETHNVVRRTPELGDDSTRDSLTPTNDWKTDAADEGAGQIVDIQSKDVDLDRYTRDEQAYANSFLPIDKPQIRNVDSEVTRNSPRQTIQHSAHHGLQPIQDSRRGERRDTEGSRDDDVEGMIEEGIRQVHEEELLEENEEENDTVQKEDRLDEAIDEAIQFEDVQGPDLEDIQAPDLEDVQAPDLEEEDLEDNLSEVSQRSAEEPIVIDKSIHMSPAQHTVRSPREICSPVSPEMLLDDEKFPSLENSPMEAIIIDRSFHMSDNQFGSSKESRIQPMSPGAHLDSDRLMTGTRSATSKEVLSRSFQGRPSPAEKTTLSRDFLSQSLISERSPLSEEIRKMFKKALEDTPPTRLSRRPPRVDPLSDGGSSPDYPSNILKQSDISWDNTENLEDIEIPELVDDLDDEEDNIDDLLQGEDRLSQSVNIDDLLNDKRNVDIDDFFATKTPELPKRSRAVSAAERSWSQGQGQLLGQGLLEKSFEDSSMDLPKFPQNNGKENESPLISFTP